MSAHVPWFTNGNQRQVVEISSFLPLRGSQGLNSAHLDSRALLLPAELSISIPQIYTFLFLLYLVH